MVIISDVSYEIRQLLKHNHLNRLRVDAVTRSHVSFIVGTCDILRAEVFHRRPKRWGFGGESLML